MRYIGAMKHGQLAFIAILLLFIACQAHPVADAGTLSRIRGSWRGDVFVGGVPRPGELLLFSERSDSSAAISVIYELGPRSRVGRPDADVTMQGHEIAWEGNRGTLNGSMDTMRVTEETRWGKNEWLFVRDPQSDAMMERLRTAGGEPFARAAPIAGDDGWKCADPAAVGIDAAGISEFLGRVAEGKHGDIHSLLIARNGTLVVEEYFADNGGIHGPVCAGVFRDRVHHLASTTKTVLSALVGIAIDRGFIEGVDEPICTYLPSYAPLFSEEKKKITVGHLLTMTPGFAWRQFGGDDRTNDGMAMWRCGDVVRYVLERPLASEPGLTFNYSNGAPVVMGVVLKNACGMEVGAFAETCLFHPLGISKYAWTSYPDGSLETDGGLALRPRDLAKIGQLYLNGGVWNGARIISAKWLGESTREHKRFGFGGLRQWGYGFYWMQNSYKIGGGEVRAFFHSGDGGQILSVLPELNMVIVATAGNYGTNSNKTYDDILESYILPAVSLESPAGR